MLLGGALKADAQFVNTGQDIFIDNQGLFFVGTTYDHSGGNVLDNGIFQITGNLTNTAANSRVFTLQSTGIVNLSGSTQIIGGTSKTSFPNLALLNAGTATLGFNADVRLNLALNTKEFKAEEFSLALVNPNVNSISRTTGFVSTDKKGKLIRATNTAGSYVFPVGSAGIYRPVNIEPANASANTFEVTFINSDPSNSGYSRNNKRTNIQTVFDKYFHIINQTGTSNSIVKVFQNTSTEGEYKQLVKYPDQFKAWENAVPSTPLDGNFGDQLNRSLTYSSISPLVDLPITFAISSSVTDQFTFYNGISPNSDGLNDKWIVDGLDLFNDNELTIYNRWGDEVFKAKNYSSATAWDGGNLNQGTYFYVLKVNIDGASKVYKGYITMIKNN